VADGALAIIAGGGPMPLTLARAAAARNRPVLIVGLTGFAEKAIDQFPHVWAGFGEVGKIFAAFADHGVTEAVMIGPVRRPDFRALVPDVQGLKLLPRIAAAAMRGDDALLRTIAETFESRGVRIVGADQVLSDLLAKEGPVGGPVPGPELLADAAKAMLVAKTLGRLDVGQGAVVAGGLVLAVEAIEGTDAMLARVAALPELNRGSAAARRGVLVKCIKPGQDRRIDLPTIGANTVLHAAEAGLAGIAVEAGATLISDPEAVASAAETYGIAVWGMAAAPL